MTNIQPEPNSKDAVEEALAELAAARSGCTAGRPPGPDPAPGGNDPTATALVAQAVDPWADHGPRRPGPAVPSAWLSSESGPSWRRCWSGQRPHGPAGGPQCASNRRQHRGHPRLPATYPRATRRMLMGPARRPRSRAARRARRRSRRQRPALALGRRPMDCRRAREGGLAHGYRRNVRHQHFGVCDPTRGTDPCDRPPSPAVWGQRARVSRVRRCGCWTHPIAERGLLAGDCRLADGCKQRRRRGRTRIRLTESNPIEPTTAASPPVSCPATLQAAAPAPQGWTGPAYTDGPFRWLLPPTHTWHFGGSGDKLVLDSNVAWGIGDHHVMAFQVPLAGTYIGRAVGTAVAGDTPLTFGGGTMGVGITLPFHVRLLGLHLRGPGGDDDHCR